MKRNMLLRLAALPFVVALGAAPGLTGCEVIGDATCPEWKADYGASLSADVDVNVKTFMVASGQFSELADEMVAKISAACANIAVSAGRDKSVWEGKEGADLVEAACNEADLGIKAVLAAAGDISIEFGVEGGECKASLDVAANCYAECDVDGKCTPAQLEAKCEPGKLAGKCSAECSGSCSVDGGSVECTGSCGATCTGTCSGDCIGRCDGNESSGQCAGMCDGQCTATCEGSCSGRCEYDAPSATCEGTCHGECSVEFEGPSCEGKIQPPECEINADCQAGCDAQVQADLVCEPPVVTYKVVGSGTAELTALAAAIETNLPEILIYAYERGTVLKDTGVTLVASGKAIVDGTAELSAKAVSCAALAAEAAASASIKVEASVSVSASVSASATSRSQ